MVKISIFDDDRSVLDDLSRRLKDRFEREGERVGIGCFLSADDIAKNCCGCDAVFLDILFPGGASGTDAARELRRQGYRGDIIFLSVVPDAFPEAFEVGAFDYIVKPLDDARFERTMSRLVSARGEYGGGRTALKTEDGHRIVNTDDILFCEVIDKTVHIHLLSGEIVRCRRSIVELSDALGELFFRCHRSYIVNLRHAAGRSGCDVKLNGGGRVPLSRLRASDFDRAVSKYLEGRALRRAK